MDTNRDPTTLDRFFAGLTEYTFQTRLGVVDPPLIDYISSLLVRFVHHDAIFRLRRPDGHRLYDVASMLVEAEARQGPPRREVHRHIGDFTLFWSGLFPEAVGRREAASTIDALIDYKAQGKRAYYLASKIPVAEHPEENEVLGRLSHEFELCCYALGELRKEWEQNEPPEGDKPVILG